MRNSFVVRLLPPQNILSKIPPLYSTEKDPDPIVWIKYFNPYGSGTWLVTEFDGHDSFFGFAKIHEGELGYFSLSELKSIKGPLGVQGIERDLHWRPKPLSQAKREEHMASNIDKGLKAIHRIACGCDAPEEPFPGLETLAEDANFDPGHVLPNDFSEGEGSLVPSLEEKKANYEPGEVLPNDFDEGEGSLVPSLEEKKASMTRYCNIYKAKNGKWYMDLAPHEGGEKKDAETYGPFDSLKTAQQYLDENFTHPGSIKTDKSGKAPVPTKSPLGGKVISPNSIFASTEEDGLPEDITAKEKWIPKDLEKGRCTPAPNPDCPVGSPQYNLAQTFKKHKGWKGADTEAEDVDAKFEEGKPADPTKHMDEESKKKWEKYHGKVEHLARTTWVVHPSQLVQKALILDLISAKEAHSREVMDAAQSVAEDLRSDWPEGEGFGSSDMTQSMKDMLNYAGIKVDWRGSRLTRLSSQDKFAAANTITIVDEFLTRLWPQAEEAITEGKYEKALHNLEMMQAAYFGAAGMNEHVVSLSDTADASATVGRLINALKKGTSEYLTGKEAVDYYVKEMIREVVPQWKKILQKYRWQAGLRAEQIISLGRDIVNYAFEELGDQGGSRIMDIFFAKGPDVAQEALDKALAQPGQHQHLHRIADDMQALYEIAEKDTDKEAAKMPDPIGEMQHMDDKGTAIGDYDPGQVTPNDFEEGEGSMIPGLEERRGTQEDKDLEAIEAIVRGDKTSAAFGLPPDLGKFYLFHRNYSVMEVLDAIMSDAATRGVGTNQSTKIEMKHLKAMFQRASGAPLNHQHTLEDWIMALPNDDKKLLLTRYKDVFDFAKSAEINVKTLERRVDRITDGDYKVYGDGEYGYSGRGMFGDVSLFAFTTPIDPRSREGHKLMSLGFAVDNMGFDYVYYTRATRPKPVPPAPPVEHLPPGQEHLHLHRIAEIAEDIESRFEEGKPADPTKDMTEEQKKEWWKHHEENKDNFKKAGVVYVDDVKKHGQWNLILRKSRPTRWDWFMENPQGGGFGMSSYTSIGSAIAAATTGKDFKGADKVWVIQALWDYNIPSRDNPATEGDYKVVKTFWQPVGAAAIREATESLEALVAEDVEGKFEEGKPADPTKHMDEDAKKEWEKYHGKVEHLATRAPAGLYGFTRSVQSSCEVASRRLQKAALRMAKEAFQKDDQVAPFLSTHSSRKGSLSAKILCSAMKELGPKVASVMRQAADTHQWSVTRTLTDDEWQEIATAAKTIFNKAKTEGIVVTGPGGFGKPHVDNTEIVFNGSAKEKLDEDNFMITPFEDLAIPQAIIGATDIAMRQWLPPDIMALSVTVPMFQQLCSLDEKSFLYKPFLKNLQKSRMIK